MVGTRHAASAGLTRFAISPPFSRSTTAISCCPCKSSQNCAAILVSGIVADLGPEGGNGGGEIVAQGTPEDVVKVKRSYTGQFLKPVLDRKVARAGEEEDRGGGVIRWTTNRAILFRDSRMTVWASAAEVA
jgi:hypothetical protein